MELSAGVVRASETAASEADRWHPKVPPVLLDEHVGRNLRGTEEAVHGRVDPHRLVDAVAVSGISVVVALFELDELELVRRVAVDFVCREEDEWGFRAAAAGALEQVQRPDGIDVEVVEWPRGREVVGWLGRAMDDEIRLLLGDDAQDRLAVADVDVTVLEMPRRSSQPLEVPGRVPVLAEEVAPHVVVDAVHAPAALVEEGHHLRSDEPAGAGDESGLRACHGS